MGTFDVELDHQLALRLAAHQEDPEQQNVASRWRQALDLYASQHVHDEKRTAGRVCMSCVIDVSSSMEGTRLDAVKLGLCALVSGLASTDKLSIGSFADYNRDITGGFGQVEAIRDQLPNMLERVTAGGPTACYDAALQGIRSLRGEQTRDGDEKHVLVLLTDGEDTSSASSAVDVLSSLALPEISNFMFILVAVEMSEAEQRVFEPWLAMRHCKQMSVSVQTGARLVRVFKEGLLDRVLQSEPGSTRFYNVELIEELDTPPLRVSSYCISRCGTDPGPPPDLDHVAAFANQQVVRSPRATCIL